MSKNIITTLSLVIVIFSIMYVYLFHSVSDPFTLDSSKYSSDTSKQQVNTINEYEFRFENMSNKKLNLLNIDLQGFKGIEIRDLKVNGKPLTKLQIPSNTEYHEMGVWRTDGQGIPVQFSVKVLESRIQNPRVVLTYSYFGIKHLQSLTPFSMTNQPGFSSQTTNSSLSCSMIPIFSEILLLCILYFKRDRDEAYLGWKLVGFDLLGGFNFIINSYILPVGILIYFFMHPRSNRNCKHFAALVGLVGMALSYVLPLLIGQ